jgi:uncharacterized protein YhfF
MKDFSKLIKYRWDFGKDKNLADKLKELVIERKKTATTDLFEQGKKVPSLGEYATILDSNGAPFCIIQYTKVQINSFLDVDYEYVKLEGEGDKDLDEWRKKHVKFFVENNEGFNDLSLVVCEEFNVVELLK